MPSSPVLLPANQPPARFYRGGERIRGFRGDHGTDDHTPEDWVASTVTVLGEASVGLTRLAESTLSDLMAEDPLAWFGPDHVERFGADPALLVKLLDAGERLPVHAHPDRQFAAAHLGSRFGKTEAWIALEPFTARVGFSREISREQLGTWIATQDSSGMLAAMTEVEVPAGASIVIPAGVAHAIDSGAFLVELQEPTDLSILMEWETFGLAADSGHLGLGFDVAMDAIDRSAWDSMRVESLMDRAGGLAPAADGFFRADKLVGGDTLEAGYSVLVITEGSGQLASAPVRRGQTWVVPYAAGALPLTGQVAAVRCRPPA